MIEHLPQMSILYHLNLILYSEEAFKRIYKFCLYSNTIILTLFLRMTFVIRKLERIRKFFLMKFLFRFF